MWCLLQIILFLATLWLLGFYRAKPMVWVPVLLIETFIFSYFRAFPIFIASVFWIILIAAMVILALPMVRKLLISRKVWRIVKKVTPVMSQTERDAIEAGDVCFEAELFNGKPDFEKLFAIPKPSLSVEEQAFLDQQVETLCAMLDDWQINHVSHDLPKAAWDYLKKEKFFAMIIPKKYGGLAFSAYANSKIVAKIGTRSIAAAVTTMVPNSLGPGELLNLYGTEAQKDYYLPRLAIGEDIPCFALTSPIAGSDAANMPDVGIVCEGEFQGKKVLGMKLTWHKHYITLAPVATVLGLAIHLKDPEHLLSGKTDVGITLCLVPTNHPGVEIGKRHQPMGLGFMNGPTSGKDVFVPLDFVIGGSKMCGHGWRMLMECLSMGRGISLPSLAVAVAQQTYRMTGAYAQIRQQFRVSIANFEGVGQKLGQIAINTYLCNAARDLTVAQIDQHKKPAIASAMTKYHNTELARAAVIDGMDIVAGRGVQLGPRNFLANMFLSAPISITVEGANILTRNLIIFGQGAIRCHPYILKTMQLAHAENTPENLTAFDRNLFAHLGFSFSNLVRTFTYGLSAGSLIKTPESKLKKYLQQLTRMSTAFALTADMLMLTFGGELKRMENLSARLGDIFSYLYYASAVIKHFHDVNQAAAELDYAAVCLDFCLSEIQIAFDDLFNNIPKRQLAKCLRFTVFPWGRAYTKVLDKNLAKLLPAMRKPNILRDQITGNCYIDWQVDGAAGRVEQALQLEVAAGPIFDKLKQAIAAGQIDKTQSLAKRLEQALSQGILSNAELDLLKQLEVIRLDVVQVDAFNT